MLKKRAYSGLMRLKKTGYGKVGCEAVGEVLEKFWRRWTVTGLPKSYMIASSDYIFRSELWDQARMCN